MNGRDETSCTNTARNGQLCIWGNSFDRSSLSLLIWLWMARSHMWCSVSLPRWRCEWRRHNAGPFSYFDSFTFIFFISSPVWLKDPLLNVTVHFAPLLSRSAEVCRSNTSSATCKTESAIDGRWIHRESVRHCCRPGLYVVECTHVEWGTDTMSRLWPNLTPSILRREMHVWNVRCRCLGEIWSTDPQENKRKGASQKCRQRRKSVITHEATYVQNASGLSNKACFGSEWRNDYYWLLSLLCLINKTWNQVNWEYTLTQFLLLWRVGSGILRVLIKMIWKCGVWKEMSGFLMYYCIIVVICSGYPQSIRK